MLKKILIGLGVLIAVFLIVVAFQPSTFRVERSITIAAPAAAVFPHLNDLRKAQVWSSWKKFDPAAKYTFEGAPEGQGAIGTWEGNNDIGAGRQTIVESKPNELVRLRLDFLKPMESTCTGEFTLKPAASAGGTTVTWALYGENNFIGKAFCLFMNQDKMIGGPFEEGLASLKALVEGGAKKS